MAKAQISSDSLDYIVNHVLLPPKLPQEGETPELVRNAEQDLLCLLRSSLERYRGDAQPNGFDPEIDRLWGIVARMLLKCSKLSSTQALSPRTLCTMFSQLKDSDVLLTYVRAQNAVLTIRRSSENIIFECFEASPQPAAVIGCKGNLIRTFPARAVAVSRETFEEDSLQTELAAFLSKANSEMVKEMMPQSFKSDSRNPETRDTADPAIVSDLLMAILGAVGEPASIVRVQKRTRDDVLWTNADVPWRRSPLWLAIRATMQTILLRALSSETATTQFKNFMIYFLADLTSVMQSRNYINETCHLITAKVAKRVYKLSDRTFDFVYRKALDICERVRTQHNSDWQKSQIADAERATRLSTYSLRDTALSLDNSRTYIKSVMANKHVILSKTSVFDPKCTSGLGRYDELPVLHIDGLDKEDVIVLFDEFESWVMEKLPAWIDGMADSVTSDNCIHIAELAEKYWIQAKEAYSCSPEQMSVMLLTILGLWHALDRVVTKMVPLMNEYSPEIPSDMFESLLLPHKAQMNWLHGFEQYIQSRRSRSLCSHPSIFSDPKDKCFAVRYYSSSATHQALRTRIEDYAKTKKSEKESEWQQMSQAHENLLAEADILDCEWIENEQDEEVERYHSKSCHKCSLNWRANKMRIIKYEWPLPEAEPACRSAVFELDCPANFVAWRNLTWMLLYDVGQRKVVRGPSPAITLSSFQGLSAYHSQKSSRVTLASQVKPFGVTHYKVHFPAQVDELFCANALRYEM